MKTLNADVRKRYLELLYDDAPETRDLTKVLQAAGGYYLSDSADKLDWGAPRSAYAKAAVKRVGGLLDFIAAGQGAPCWERASGDLDGSAIFLRQDPVIDPTKEAELPVVPKRPKYLWNVEVDCSEMSHMEMSEDEIDRWAFAKRLEAANPDIRACVIGTHDGFAGSALDSQRLAEFARSNKPVAITRSQLGSCTIFVLVQSRTMSVPKSFELIEQGVTLPNAVEIPESVIDRPVLGSLTKRWEDRMVPLLSKPNAAKTYMEKFGRGISAEKLAGLIQVAVGEGQLEVAKAWELELAQMNAVSSPEI